MAPGDGVIFRGGEGEVQTPVPPLDPRMFFTIGL